MYKLSFVIWDWQSFSLMERIHLRAINMWARQIINRHKFMARHPLTLGRLMCGHLVSCYFVFVWALRHINVRSRVMIVITTLFPRALLPIYCINGRDTRM